MRAMETKKRPHIRAAFLVELSIFFAAGLVALLIWLPSSRAQQIAAGEEKALAFLRTIAERASVGKDASDLRTLLTQGNPLVPATATFHTESLLELDGYYFRLQAKAGDGKGWTIYAWPGIYGQTGNAAFFFDPPQTTLETRNHRRRYSGLRRQPQEKAAMPAGTGENASFGKDAQEWFSIEEKNLTMPPDSSNSPREAR